VQKAFTVPKPKNPILFSAEMAVYGIVFLLIKEMCFGAKFTDTFSLKLFHNWTAMTLIPVFTNASFWNIYECIKWFIFVSTLDCWIGFWRRRCWFSVEICREYRKGIRTDCRYHCIMGWKNNFQQVNYDASFKVSLSLHWPNGWLKKSLLEWNIGLFNWFYGDTLMTLTFIVAVGWQRRWFLYPFICTHLIQRRKS